MGMRFLFAGVLALSMLPGFVAAAPEGAEAAEAGDIEASFRYGHLLEIRFPEPMQVWSNARDAVMVRLEPALPVECNWSSDTSLQCNAAGEAGPVAATRYRVIVSAGLKTQDGVTLPAQVLHAETSRPSLGVWIMQWQADVPRVMLNSNVPTTVEALQAVLRATLDGEGVALPPLKLSHEGGRWNREQRFELDLSGIVDRDRVFALAVSPGLRSTVGPLSGTQDETVLRVLLNETQRLRGADCAGRERGTSVQNTGGTMSMACFPGENVQLHFSHPLDEPARRIFEDGLPDGVTLHAWRDGHHVMRHGVAGDGFQFQPGVIAALSVDDPVTERVIELPEGLLARDGGEAFQPARIEIRTGPFRPALRAPRSRALLVDGDAPPVLAQAFHSGPRTVQAQSVVDRTTSFKFDTPLAQPTEARAIDSPQTRDALNKGGWVRWAFSVDSGEGNHRAALQFAAPDFDLYAVAGRREVLAWANTWESDVPVIGSEVELLWLDAADAQPRVVARARTGDDGVAWLRLPEDMQVEAPERSGEYPLWMLRATHGRGRHLQRAVLPAWQVTRWGEVLGRPSPTRLWGVSDRPLYRAGDTVRYRLWQRREEGGRLLRTIDPVPRELRLYSQEEGKTVRRWQATPAEDGTFIGEAELPIHLVDGTYCIGAGGGEVEGTCFFVGTYRAQDLWAEAKTSARTLRDGDRFEVDVEAGYYSGGSAAGLPLSRVTTMLTGLPLQQAYPQYAGYEFINVFGSEDARHGVGLAGASELVVVTDGDGRARIELPVAFRGQGDEPREPPAFGQLQLVAEVRLDDREGTVTNAAKARYAHHDRYVGLRIEPRWIDAASPVQLQAVVIDADGSAVEEAQVEVEVHFLPGFDVREDALPELLMRCTAGVGEASPCDFPRTRTGRYRLTARSGDAAPVEVVRHVWVGDRTPTASATRALELLQLPEAAAEPVRVLLKQPLARAKVLFVFTRGETILGHRVEAVEGGIAPFALPLDPAWHGAMRLHAHVRDAAPAMIEDGVRRPVSSFPMQIDLALPGAEASTATVDVAFDAPVSAPGERRVLRIHNRSDESRDVTVAVMDDALRALAGELLAHADPHGKHWLGREEPHWGRIAQASFAQWAQAGQMHLALPWPGSRTLRGADMRENCRIYTDPAEAAACMAANAAEAAADAAAAAAGDGYASGGMVDESRLKRADVRHAPVVFDDPASVDLAQPIRMLAPPPPPAPPAPPSAMPDVGGSTDGSSSLDRIQVTGSRISLVDVFSEGAQVQRGLRPREAQDRALMALARVRTRFADTVLWLPQLRLAPGEAREIELELPDNLTRWRALAWSSDADEDFHVAEATLESGLPLEVRLQSPVRLYPGDASRLAANLRQSGDVETGVRAELHVEGIEVPSHHAEQLVLPARGQASVAMTIAPVQAGMLQVVAAAEAEEERDAVAGRIEVASPLIQARKVQAGWLGGGAMSLDLPPLPPGAGPAQLRVGLLHGTAGLVERWTQDMRDYTHRCWEQILSRAVAAALAIERGDTASWPDAGGAIAEAIDNAAVFQGEEGDFRFFADTPSHDEDLYDRRPHVALTAYSLRAFAVLRELGHDIDPEVEERAREFLEDVADGGLEWEDDRIAANEIVFAIEATESARPDVMDALEEVWDELSLPGRIALARMMQRQGHASASDAIDRLLSEAPARGVARVLRTSRDDTRWMGSQMREQCALIGLLDAGKGDDERSSSRRGLVAGLSDLYAGGVSSVDTQTAATCLMALRADASAAHAGDATVVLQQGTSDEVALVLTAGERHAEWVGASPGDRILRMQPNSLSAAPVSFVAELTYEEDARLARASAVGLSLDRRYAVLRDGAWAPVEGQRLQEGDWIRVSLVVNTVATRHFVAITDAVPGGLRPTDLALSGIAGLDLASVSDEGSHWFGTRRLDPRSPKFYAESLPAGEHLVHYFARIGNSGDYLAAPAMVELMYGNASTARTAARRIVIDPPMHER